MPTDGRDEPQAAAAARRRRPAWPAPRAGGSTTDARCDWRQISAPPPAGEHERPDDRVAEPDAPRAEQQQHGERPAARSRRPPASSRAGRSDARTEPPAVGARASAGSSDPADRRRARCRRRPRPSRSRSRRAGRAGRRRGAGRGRRRRRRATAPERSRRSGARLRRSGTDTAADVLTRRARAGPSARRRAGCRRPRPARRRQHVVAAQVEHVGLVEQQDACRARSRSGRATSDAGVEAGARRSWRPRAGGAGLVAGSHARRRATSSRPVAHR